jgi:CRP-like cAMP-binding protein
MLVTTLQAGVLFGDMPLLGQSMYSTQAIAGSGGAALGSITIEQVGRLLDSTFRRVLEKIGPRLIQAETEQYRAAFQTVGARIAAFLLDVTGAGSVVEG